MLHASPKQGLSPAQEGLFRKGTGAARLCGSCCSGAGTAPCPPAALGGQQEAVAAESNSKAGAELDDTHMLVKVRLVWMLLFLEVEAPWDRCLPNGTSL